MEDSGTAFDEELRVDTTIYYWLHGVLGSRPPLRRVRVTAAGVEVEGDRSTLRNQILDARLVEKKDSAFVVIVDRALQQTTIEVPTPQEGVRLLAALGQRITRKNKPISMRMPKRITFDRFAIAFALLFCLFGLLTEFGPRPTILVIGAMAILYRLLMVLDRAPRLVIGRDGILVSRRSFLSFRPRYISFRDVVAVRRYSVPYLRTNPRVKFGGDGILVELGNDESLKLGIEYRDGRTHDGPGPFEEIRDALDAWRKELPTEASDALARSGRPTQEWMASLKQLGASEEAVYRVAAVDRETLFAIVEDPANEAVSRAAAAVALGAALDDDARARLVRSAQAIAEPRLRVAIDRVLEQRDEEKIAAALDDLDPVQKVIR